MTPDPRRTLRRLVQLAKKANRSQTAIPMNDVFDEEEDRRAWLDAWADAEEIVKASPN